MCKRGRWSRKPGAQANDHVDGSLEQLSNHNERDAGDADDDDADNDDGADDDDADDDDDDDDDDADYDDDHVDSSLEW